MSNPTTRQIADVALMQALMPQLPEAAAIATGANPAPSQPIEFIAGFKADAWSLYSLKYQMSSCRWLVGSGLLAIFVSKFVQCRWAGAPA